MKYWVSTESGYRVGPYEDYANAFYAALELFGFEGWTISSSMAC